MNPCRIPCLLVLLLAGCAGLDVAGPDGGAGFSAETPDGRVVDAKSRESTHPLSALCRRSTVARADPTATPVHDDEGRLKQDGRWDYQWDAESRLVEMVMLRESPCRIEGLGEFWPEVIRERPSASG